MVARVVLVDGGFCGSPATFQRVGLIVKFVGPLTKLLAYIVATSDAEQFATPFSSCAQRPGVHADHPYPRFSSYEHGSGDGVLKN